MWALEGLALACSHMDTYYKGLVWAHSRHAPVELMLLACLWLLCWLLGVAEAGIHEICAYDLRPAIQCLDQARQIETAVQC